MTRPIVHTCRICRGKGHRGGHVMRMVSGPQPHKPDCYIYPRREAKRLRCGCCRGCVDPCHCCKGAGDHLGGVCMENMRGAEATA